MSKKREPMFTDEEIAQAEAEKDAAAEEVTEEQIAESEKKLFDTILQRAVTQKHGIILSQERYAVLERMEDAARDMAEYVVAYFKRKDMDARKRLILKAVEILQTNPAPGFSAEQAEVDSRGLQTDSRDLRSNWNRVR